MQNSQVKKSVVSTSLKRAGVAVVAAVGSAAANAADHTAQIGAAATEAQTNQGAVIAAVIGIAVIGFGVSALVGWMRK